MKFTEEMFLPKIYTSYYSKLAGEYKVDDIYIQVSRTIFCPKKNLDGIRIAELIDYNIGDKLGNYSDNLKDYYNSLDNELIISLLDNIVSLPEERKKQLILSYGQAETVEKSIENLNLELAKGNKDIIELWESLQEETEKPKILLLCFENLEKKYTDADNKKYKNCKSGEYKKCHRRILAQKIKELYNISIPEYDIKKENEKIVYRNYF